MPLTRDRLRNHNSSFRGCARKCSGESAQSSGRSSAHPGLRPLTYHLREAPEVLMRLCGVPKAPFRSIKDEDSCMTDSAPFQFLPPSSTHPGCSLQLSPPRGIYPERSSCMTTMASTFKQIRVILCEYMLAVSSSYRLTASAWCHNHRIRRKILSTGQRNGKVIDAGF